MATVLACCTFIGCKGPGQFRYLDRLTISSTDYHRTFDEAVAVARQESFIGGLRDRRTGVIETEPNRAPTLIEPWHAHGEAFDRLIEGTTSLQQRRARFEFIPRAAGEGEAVRDLMAHDGDLEVRVFVYVERLDTVGRRRSTWTRRVASAEEIWDVQADAVVRGTWVPVGRDTAMERRLLAKLEAALR